MNPYVPLTGKERNRLGELMRAFRLHPFTSELERELRDLLERNYNTGHKEVCSRYWENGLGCPCIEPYVTMDEMRRIREGQDVDPGFGPAW